MVRKEGQENGKCICDLPGYQSIEPKTRNQVNNYIRDQDHVDKGKIELDEVIVFGSYGDGYGVPHKSDLDIVLSFSTGVDYRSNDLSTFLKEVIGVVNVNEKSILSNIDEIDDIEPLAYPMLEVQQRLQEMAQHEPVENYYSLTKDRKHSLY